MSTNELLEQLGPVAGLIGAWEGDKGDDIAPNDDRSGAENNKYRERIVFEHVGPVQNHEQNLHVLRYSLRAWRIGEPDSFHEELGYWSWEPATKQVMRSFLIPRGIAVIAGGEAEKTAREFTLRSASGSSTFGLCTNPFLDREFKIVSFEMNVRLPDANSFHYDQNTVIKIPGRPALFDHRDKNALVRAKV